MTEEKMVALNTFLAAVYGLLVATAGLFGDAVAAFVTAAVLPVIRGGVGLWFVWNRTALPMDETANS